MKKYYAVRKGILPGIYLNWEECQAQVIHFKNAEYCSFSNIEDAKNYLNENKVERHPAKCTAYIDGSFNVKTNEYSFGAVLLTPTKEYKFKKKYESDEYSKYRNVAGEVKGAGFIIQYAINHDIKELDVYYDYEGIRSWYVGDWKANTPLTQTYRKFASESANLITVNFIKVKSHSNDKYNDIADQLAKDALGI